MQIVGEDFRSDVAAGHGGVWRIDQVNTFASALDVNVDSASFPVNEGDCREQGMECRE